MRGNKALRRAVQTTDAVRLTADLPLITDSTELITPERAELMLQNNRNNRPVNWTAVEKLSEVMRAGEWKLHAQGIILDGQGNILTGQTRLWAVVYSGQSVHMRVSRGSPADTAMVIDRGRPQSARDLASRNTERRHSPIESSIARCVCVLEGKTKPTADDIASAMSDKNMRLQAIVKAAKGGKKSKAMLMIMGAICNSSMEVGKAMKSLDVSAARLEVELTPYKADSCWGKGASFGMALEKARKIVGQ